MSVGGKKCTAVFGGKVVVLLVIGGKHYRSERWSK